MLTFEILVDGNSFYKNVAVGWVLSQFSMGGNSTYYMSTIGIWVDGNSLYKHFEIGPRFILSIDDKILIYIRIFWVLCIL